MTARPRKALVIGAGPVGALTALSLHRRGWEVEIWESREDPRGQDVSFTNLRSINLAISSRGLEALRSVDPSLAEDFMAESIPMKGRMIHHLDGREESQLYDPKHGQNNNSCSRSVMNQRLVKALPSDVKMRFETKLSRIDFRTKQAYGVSRPSDVAPGEEQTDTKLGGPSRPRDKRSAKEDSEGTPFDLVIGCDGSWSKVRSEMMRVQRMDFSQSFITHAYIELLMPPNPTRPGHFAMDKNHLHIWPRHSFMLIGLPNLDGSFTLTLFLPFSSLELIKTREAASRFFHENFQSAVDLVGEDMLLDDFENNPRGSLVTINVTPSSWSSHALLLGDACHSMVPFYGQGLNCGLEDVRVLNSYLEKHNVSPTTTLPLGETDPALADVLEVFSSERAVDLQAICQLALDNYTEMRSHVLSPLHHLRRFVDSIFSAIMPSQRVTTLSLTEPFPTKRVQGWVSLYEMVTFRPDIGYGEALRREQWQKRIVSYLGYGGGLSLAMGLVLGASWSLRRFKVTLR